MSNRSTSFLFILALFLLAAPLLSSCDSPSSKSSTLQTSAPPKLTPRPSAVAFSSCQKSSATSSSSTPRSLYFGGSKGTLYAVNAQTGTPRWCLNLNPSVTQTNPCAGQHCSRPPSMMVRVGRPAVVAGVVYVCASTGGANGYLYAFNARDGSLRWRTQTGCWTVDIPFADYALPLISNGVVYSGLYAVRASDGHALWKSHIDLAKEGELMLLQVANGMVFACTEGAVYALNTQDGAIRWRYPSQAFFDVGGPLSVSNQVLIVGTAGSVSQPQTSAIYALNAQNGSLLWYHLMGDYVGASFLNNVVYVSSRDQYLYAFNPTTGKILWRHQFSYPVYNSALALNKTLYLNIDGANALDSASGKILWHQSLGSSQSVDFLPSVVVDGVDYLVKVDGSGNSTVYALNASNGAEHWHSAQLPQISPLTVA